jgi:hypothetical protein
VLIGGVLVLAYVLVGAAMLPAMIGDPDNAEEISEFSGWAKAEYAAFVLLLWPLLLVGPKE